MTIFINQELDVCLDREIRTDKRKLSSGVRVSDLTTKEKNELIILLSQERASLLRENQFLKQVILKDEVK